MGEIHTLGRSITPEGDRAHECTKRDADPAIYTLYKQGHTRGLTAREPETQCLTRTLRVVATGQEWDRYPLALSQGGWVGHQERSKGEQEAHRRHDVDARKEETRFDGANHAVEDAHLSHRWDEACVHHGDEGHGVRVAAEAARRKQIACSGRTRRLFRMSLPIYRFLFVGTGK